MEDVDVLQGMMLKQTNLGRPVNWELLLKNWAESRKPNTDAISELAL